MAKKSVGAQVRDGFRRTGAWLLGIGWFGLVLAGLIAGAGPQGAHRPILGWSLLAAAAVIFFWTMDRWAKVFPALTGVATLNGLIMLSTGHKLGEPGSPVSRGVALLGVVTMVVATLATARFTRTKPRLPDRVALFAFVACFVWGMADEKATSLALVVALVSVLVAWGVSSFQRHRDRKGGHAPASDPTRSAAM